MRKNERGLSMNPAGCCRHLAGRGIREQLCRRDVGSTLLAALFDSFEVHFFLTMRQTPRSSPFPYPTSFRTLPWESGAEAARTPDASRQPGVSESREAFGVRPIYRRFPSSAARPPVHGPNACEKTKEGSP